MSEPSLKSGIHPQRMEFSKFTIILTDRCNFHCSYCSQRIAKRWLDISTVTKTLDFIYPRLTRTCHINFYGGEPLLAFDRIRKTVAYLERLNRQRTRKIHYSISTNGSLLTEEILQFLDEHAFFLLLSFDGWAQDISRKKGSFDFIVSLIPEILKRRRISLETNSVFTSETVGHLSKSIRLIIRLGVPGIHIGFSSQPRWTPSSLIRMKKEIAAVRTSFIEAYERITDIPWVEMTKKYNKAIYRCDAGRDQLALAADGKIWGCFLFPHYFDGRNGDREREKYCFGKVDSFLHDPEAIYARTMSAIAGLGMDNFSTPERHCVMCEEIESCWVCPIAAAFSSRAIGKISLQTCRMTRMMRREKDFLLKGFEKKRRGRGARIKAAGLS
ncbi:MAG: radical SAM protein [Candidatus Aminicenantes bacterium]|nr:radical SAM protein [Candidatus Aminicenantes bacterium]